MSRFLIVAPNWLGDAVMALPAIADVRRALPDDRIVVAAPPAIVPLFSLVGDVDEVVEKGVGRGFSRPASKTPPDPFFDTALLLPNSFRSALEVARLGIPARWGYKSGGRGFLLTRGVTRPPAGLHLVDYYQRLVGALGFANGSSALHVEVSPELRAAGARALSAAGWDRAAPLVALAPGAAFGGSKRWPPHYFAELARGFSSDGIVSVLVGSVAEEAIARQIQTARGSEPTALINLVGRTDLPTLAGLLTHARALVGNDSGATHLAAAVGIPVTAVFGPTNEQLTAPRSAAGNAVLTHAVWCRPCMLRTCPLDHACMQGVAAEDVAAATRRFL